MLLIKTARLKHAAFTSTSYQHSPLQDIAPATPVDMAADRRHEQAAGRSLPPKDAENDSAPQNYGSDLSKARDLYDTVNKALTTTANGEFFEGSKSSNAN